MNKDEKYIKKDILKRLRRSDKGLWRKLSLEERDSVVNRYYHFADIENIGIQHVLEDNRNLRREIVLMIMSLLLGFFGSISSSVFDKHFPQGIIHDVFFMAGFVIIIGSLFYFGNKVSVDRLREDGVLKYLVEQTRKSDKES